MKRYFYSYQAITRFNSPVTWHFYHLRALPVENCFQKPVEQSLFISPSEEKCSDRDCWGNLIQYGSILAPHTHFTYVSSGIIETGPYLIPEEKPSPVYSVPSTFTQMSTDMETFMHARRLQGKSLRIARTLSHRLYKIMRYKPESTRNTTRAAQAFAQREGVCQDYAHILIALCRAQGIPARYVCGLIAGEGATHAWVEVYAEDHCWHGIDPTNDQLIETGYIKIAHGRDVADCPVNRGLFRGVATQETQVRILVEEL